MHPGIEPWKHAASGAYYELYAAVCRRLRCSGLRIAELCSLYVAAPFPRFADPVYALCGSGCVRERKMTGFVTGWHWLPTGYARSGRCMKMKPTG